MTRNAIYELVNVKNDKVVFKDRVREIARYIDVTPATIYKHIHENTTIVTKKGEFLIREYVPQERHVIMFYQGESVVFKTISAVSKALGTSRDIIYRRIESGNDYDGYTFDFI